MVRCDVKTFLSLDESEREKTLEKCTSEQKIELYLAWSSATIPTNHEFAPILAKTGEALLEALLRRLEKRDSIEDEIDAPKLLIVLDEMQLGGYYSVSKDTELMSRVDSVVLSISDDQLREWALHIVEQIKVGLH